ncbi:hypothetical protein ACRARG_05950 [Pseudooceanicola sp. C21-150M6]|uniref:hypothetical protein n=1 Tax=Pseudooceanicola sp. C21-150M6 TaxID=3434355 RepID=UPI003D7F84F2
MSGNLIATTSSEGMKPLGSQAQRSFELIQSVVSSRFGEDHAALFSEPVSTDFGDQTDWYAEREGRIEKLSDLSEEEQAELRATLERLVGDIRAGATELSASSEMDDQRLSEALMNAVEVPDESAIYAVRGPEGLSPVLVNWARVADVQAPVRGVLSGQSRASQKAAAGAAAAAATASVAGAGADAAEAEALRDRPGILRRFAGLFIGLGWLLLAAICTAILVLMIEPCRLNLPILGSWCPVAVIEPEPEPALSESNVLRNRIAQLERQIAIADRVCQPEIEEKAEIVPPVVPPAAPPALPPIPEMTPSQTAQLCGPDGLALQTEELVILVDASGSMELPADFPPGLGERYYSVAEQMQSASSSYEKNRLGRELDLLVSQLERVPGPDRMWRTRDVLSQTVQRAPANIGISMLVFENCGRVRDAGSYGPAQRGQLQNAINSLRPVGRTALAEAIRQAGGKIRGGRSVEQPANVLLISDGLDNCSGDPCAAAQQLKRQRPGVSVNILDLGRSSALRCVADATGGFYVQADQVGRTDLATVVREAAGFEGRGLCR